MASDTSTATPIQGTIDRHWVSFWTGLQDLGGLLTEKLSAAARRFVWNLMAEMVVNSEILSRGCNYSYDRMTAAGSGAGSSAVYGPMRMNTTNRGVWLVNTIR